MVADMAGEVAMVEVHQVMVAAVLLVVGPNMEVVLDMEEEEAEDLMVVEINTEVVEVDLVVCLAHSVVVLLVAVGDSVRGSKRSR
jgi:hypothetical protein